MILSRDQLTALDQGAAVAVTIAERECVVLRKDVFEKVPVLKYDDSEMDPRETYPAVLRAWDQEDNSDDHEVYKRET